MILFIKTFLIKTFYLQGSKMGCLQSPSATMLAQLINERATSSTWTDTIFCPKTCLNHPTGKHFFESPNGKNAFWSPNGKNDFCSFILKSAGETPYGGKWFFLTFSFKIAVGPPLVEAAYVFSFKSEKSDWHVVRACARPFWKWNHQFKSGNSLLKTFFLKSV